MVPVGQREVVVVLVDDLTGDLFNVQVTVAAFRGDSGAETGLATFWDGGVEAKCTAAALVAPWSHHICLKIQYDMKRNFSSW